MAEESKINGLAWFVAGLGVGALVGSFTHPKAGAKHGKTWRMAHGREPSILRARTRQAAEQVSNMVEKGKEQVNGWTIGSGTGAVGRICGARQESRLRAGHWVNAAVDAGRAFKVPAVPVDPTE